MRSAILLLLGAASLFSQGVLSPEVRPDRTVTFRLRAPNAQKVEVGLEGLPRAAMTKGDDGVWTLTTSPLAPDLYGYSYVIDGTGFVDPSNGVIQNQRSLREQRRARPRHAA